MHDWPADRQTKQMCHKDVLYVSKVASWKRLFRELKKEFAGSGLVFK